MSVVYFILGLLAKLQFILSATLLWLAGKILNLIVSEALNVHNMASVEKGWSIARDTVNMFFVIFLLVIAFATILRIEAYQYKQLLPKLIISILLVNFSRTICAALIEFSNVLTRAFLNFSSTNDMPAAIAALMGVESVYEIDNSIPTTSITNSTMFLSLIFIIALVTALAMAFTGLAGMLLIRTVALLVLVVLSPLAFAMNVLPLTKSYFSQWWDAFLKYLFYAPIASFMLYLAASVASESRQVGNAGLGNAINGLSSRSDNGVNAASVLPTTITDDEFLWEFILVLGLLFIGISMIKEGGSMAANLSMDMAKRGVLGAYGFGGKWARRKLASKGLGKRAQSLKKGGLLSKGLGYGLQGLNAAAKATYAPKAWAEQRAKEEKKVGDVSVGWARDRINKTLGLVPGAAKDKTDYEERALMNLVKEEMGNLAIENPSEAQEYFTNAYVNAVNDGELDRLEALDYRLGATCNDNEVTRREAENREFGSEVHSDDRFIGMHNAEAMFDRLKTVYGEEKAKTLMLKLGEQGKSNGNWAFSHYIKVNKDGELEVDAAEWHKGWAAEFAKRGSDEKVRNSRFTFNEVKYNADGSEDVVGAVKGYQEYVESHGWGGQDASRASRNMAAKTRQSLLDANSFTDIEKIIRKQLGNKDTRGRGENNLDLYLEIAQAEGWNFDKGVQKQIEALVKDFKVDMKTKQRSNINLPSQATGPAAGQPSKGKRGGRKRRKKRRP